MTSRSSYTPDFRLTKETQATDISILDAVHSSGLQAEWREGAMEVVVVDSYDDLLSGN